MHALRCAVILMGAALLLGIVGLRPAPSQAAPPKPRAVTPLASPGVSTSPASLCTDGWTVIGSPNIVSRTHALNAISAVAPNDMWAVGNYAISGTKRTLVEHWDGSQWAMFPSPDIGPYFSTLAGVVMVASNDVWAVGSIDQNGRPSAMTMHWDGSTWTIVPTPYTSSGSALRAVSARASNDVWAVGYTTSPYPDSNQAPLILHWDGLEWSVMPTTVPPGINTTLGGVRMLTATNGWAVGYSAANNGEALTLHWDGTTWNQVATPISATLRAISGTANDLWAVGIMGYSGPSVALHWNGSQWTNVPVPQSSNQLNGVAWVAANDVWAVGGAVGNPPSHASLIHWNGSVWASVPGAPTNARDDYLQAITAGAGGTLWTVGGYYNGGGQYQALVERWTGTLWQQVAAPTIHVLERTNYLNGVTAIAEDDVWAVGSYPDDGGSSTEYPLLEHWNGQEWAIVQPDDQTGLHRRLNAVAGSASNDIWAVGAVHDGVSDMWPLLLHWDGLAWTTLPPPGGTRGYRDLLSVDVRAADDAWAVGFDASGGSASLSQTFIVHWDGLAWTQVPSPSVANRNNQLNGVSIVGPNDVWAVGSLFSAGQKDALIEHWNGVAWSIVPTPPTPPNGTALLGVAARTANDVWAVGKSGANLENSDQALTLHWDGLAWATVPVPSLGPGTSRLSSVVAPANGAVVAAGSSTAPGGFAQTLLLQWDGQGWTRMPSPNVGPENNQLTALAAGPESLWAVGTRDDDVYHTPQTLTQRYRPLPFGDVSPANPFYAYIRCLVCQGILSGYSDGLFRPNAPVTRGQMSKMIANAAGLNDPLPPAQQTFSDVPPSSPFWAYIERLAQHGYISGYGDGTFGPGAPITRGQLAKVTANAAGLGDPVPASPTFSDVPASDPFYVFIERVVAHGIISGYGCDAASLNPCSGLPEACPGRYFRPCATATRAQTAKIVATTFYPTCQAAAKP